MAATKIATQDAPAVPAAQAAQVASAAPAAPAADTYSPDPFTAQCLKRAKGNLKKNFSGVPWTTVSIPLDEAEERMEYQYIEVVHNGVIYTIMRGEDVPIPVPLWLVLANSERYAKYVMHGPGAKRHLYDRKAAALIGAASDRRTLESLGVTMEAQEGV